MQYADTPPPHYRKLAELHVNEEPGAEALLAQMLAKHPKYPPLLALAALMGVGQDPSGDDTLLAQSLQNLQQYPPNSWVVRHTALLAACFIGHVPTEGVRQEHISDYPHDIVLLNLFTYESLRSRPVSESERQTQMMLLRIGAKDPRNKGFILSRSSEILGKGGHRGHAVDVARSALDAGRTFESEHALVHALHGSSDYNLAATASEALPSNPAADVMPGRAAHMAFHVALAQICAGRTEDALHTIVANLGPFANSVYNPASGLLLAAAQSQGYEVPKDVWQRLVDSSLPAIGWLPSTFDQVVVAAAFAAAHKSGASKALVGLKMSGAAFQGDGTSVSPYAGAAVIATLINDAVQNTGNGLVADAEAIAPFVAEVSSFNAEPEWQALLMTVTGWSAERTASIVFPDRAAVLEQAPRGDSSLVIVMR